MLGLYRGYLDTIVTGLVIISGADFIGRRIQLSGAYDGEADSLSRGSLEIGGRPVRIRGTTEHIVNEDADQGY